MSTDAEKRDAAIADYRKKLLKHKEIDGKVRTLRESVKELKKEYEKTEDDLKALQSVGQIIGEVLRQLDDERCKYEFTPLVISGLSWITMYWHNACGLGAPCHTELH